MTALVVAGYLLLGACVSGVMVGRYDPKFLNKEDAAFMGFIALMWPVALVMAVLAYVATRIGHMVKR